MSVNIGEYEIRYHQEGEAIDPDNYKNLANATFWLKDTILPFVWDYVQNYFKPERYTTYEGFRTYLSGYQAKRVEGYYNVATFSSLYPKHYTDLKDVLMALVILMEYQANWMVEDGYILSSDVFSEISNAIELARRYPHFLKGDTVKAEYFNMLVDLVQETYNIYKKLFTALKVDIIYMLSTGDWDRAKKLITNGSVVFIGYHISGVYGWDIKPYLDNYRCIVVNLIDTQPYYRYPLDTFYNILYTSSEPTSAIYERYSVIHSCFQARIGVILPVSWDYAISHVDKRSDAVIYAKYVGAYVYSWCYVAHAKGYVIEAPFDGTVAYVSYFTKFMDAFRDCLIPNITNIIYLAGYSAMDGAVDVADVLRAYAEQIGWRVVDMR